MGRREVDPHCLDCQLDVYDANEYAYMVHKSVWYRAKGFYGLLCIGCLEKRLGCQLTAHDFDWSVPLTCEGLTLKTTGPKQLHKSPRLTQSMLRLVQGEVIDLATLSFEEIETRVMAAMMIEGARRAQRNGQSAYLHYLDQRDSIDSRLDVCQLTRGDGRA